MAPIPPEIKPLWRDYASSSHGRPAEFKTDKANRQWFELSYNGRILKYTVAVFGNQPSSGYPLYIGLHGGGSDKDGKENDISWWDMSIRYYCVPVEKHAREKHGAVYVAARGVSAGTLEKRTENGLVDTYDLHSQPESYVLLEQMITNLLLPKPKEIDPKYVDYSQQLNPEAQHLVNPDQVYLLGFSAGGDGVYQLSPKIADRFAAVNMGGGHPNDATFVNLANLPICLQVGEKDIYNSDGIYFDRAKVTVKANFELDKLCGQPGGAYRDNYRHECFVVKNGEHAAWSQPDQADKEQLVLKNLLEWYSNPKGPGAEESDPKNINPVRWVSNFARNPTPPFVTWDLSARPPKPKGVGEDWVAKRHFYWLFIRKPKPTDLGEGDVIRASYNKSLNSVWVEKPTNYLGILLNQDMLDLNKGIDVSIGGTKLTTVNVSPSKKIRKETLEARGDVRLVFSTMLYFEHTAGKGWEVKTADSLYGDGT